MTFSALGNRMCSSSTLLSVYVCGSEKEKHELLKAKIKKQTTDQGPASKTN